MAISFAMIREQVIEELDNAGGLTTGELRDCIGVRTSILEEAMQRLIQSNRIDCQHGEWVLVPTYRRYTP